MHSSSVSIVRDLLRGGDDADPLARFACAEAAAVLTGPLSELIDSAADSHHRAELLAIAIASVQQLRAELVKGAQLARQQVPGFRLDSITSVQLRAQIRTAITPWLSHLRGIVTTIHEVDGRAHG